MKTERRYASTTDESRGDWRLIPLAARDDWRLIPCAPIVGDVLKFIDRVHATCVENVGRTRTIVARVLEVTNRPDPDCPWEEEEETGGPLIHVPESYRLEVIESTGPDQVAVGATILRTVQETSVGTHLRLPWADESTRAELT